VNADFVPESSGLTPFSRERRAAASDACA